MPHQDRRDIGCRNRSICLDTSEPFQNYFLNGTMLPLHYAEHGVEMKDHPRIPDLNLSGVSIFPILSQGPKNGVGS